MSRPIAVFIKPLLLICALFLAGCATAAKPGNMAVLDNSIAMISENAPAMKASPWEMFPAAERQTPYGHLMSRPMISKQRLNIH